MTRKLERTRPNSDEAGATPPFDAPCVAGPRGVAPAFHTNSVTVLAASIRRGRQFRMGWQNIRSSRKEKSPVAALTPRPDQQCRRSLRSVKKVRIALCTFGTGNFFTRRSTCGICSQGFAKSESAKVTVQKRLNRAGATPLFCGQSAQKFPGVAPALPGTYSRRFARWHAWSQEFVKQHV